MNFQSNGDLVVPILGPINEFLTIPWRNTELFRNVVVFPTSVQFSRTTGTVTVNTDSFSLASGVGVVTQAAPTVTVNMIRTFPVDDPPPVPLIRVELLHRSGGQLPSGEVVFEGEVEVFEVAGWFLSARLSNALKGDVFVVKLSVPTDGTWTWRVGVSTGC